jgi:Xaa-Pro aminopeptidase
MNALKDVIREGISEREIVCKAENIMRDKGVHSFWYHGVGAYVHVGKRTTTSESGKGYKPSGTVVGRNDIVTVDLSPEINTYWGDFARTFIVVNGSSAFDAIHATQNELVKEFTHGVNIEKQLHNVFVEYVKPDMTFEEVYIYIAAH